MLQLQRAYGNRAVGHLLASGSLLQRLHITVKGTLTEGKGRDKKTIDKTVVIDTDEKDDSVLLAQISEARKIDTRCIDLMDAVNLKALDARLKTVDEARQKEFAPTVRKVRVALGNREAEKKEAAESEKRQVDEEEEELTSVLTDEEVWTRTIASLAFESAVTDKFMLDHVLRVGAADNEEEVAKAAKVLFAERQAGQPSLSKSTLLVFDASAQARVVAEMKQVNADMHKLPYRGVVFTTQTPYVMVTVSKAEGDSKTLSVARTSKAFKYTTDSSSLFVMGARKHTKAMHHFEGPA